MKYGLWVAILTVGCTSDAGKERSTKAAPVETAPVVRGAITLTKTYSGTLEAPTRFVVAAKIPGRIERLHVNISDDVERGAPIAELDSAEYALAVTQAKADLAVAKANYAEAKASFDAADRELARSTTLKDRGLVSDSQFDSVGADRAARQAQVQVAQAQKERAEAALQTARVQLGYTKVGADWTEGDSKRIVAERFVSEGDTVSAGQGIASIVDLDPLVGVIYVTEKDYPYLKAGQSASLRVDAYGGNAYTATIGRLAPVFQEGSRQARVELTVPNPDHHLKPGMFLRADIVVATAEDAVVVPESALTKRSDKTGVFLVNDADSTVTWHVVQPGIRNAGRVQLLDSTITGRVVTLGHQLVDNGSTIVVREAEPETPAPPDLSGQ